MSLFAVSGNASMGVFGDAHAHNLADPGMSVKDISGKLIEYN